MCASDLQVHFATCSLNLQEKVQFVDGLVEFWASAGDLGHFGVPLSELSSKSRKVLVHLSTASKPPVAATRLLECLRMKFEELPDDVWLNLFDFLSWRDRIRLEAVCRHFQDKAWRRTSKHLAIESWGPRADNDIVTRTLDCRATNIESLALGPWNKLNNSFLANISQACPNLRSLDARAAREATSKKDGNLKSLQDFLFLRSFAVSFGPKSIYQVSSLPPSLRHLQVQFLGQTVPATLARSFATALWAQQSLHALDISYPCCNNTRLLNPVGCAAESIPPLQSLSICETGLGESHSLYWCILISMGQLRLSDLCLNGLALSDALLRDVLLHLPGLRTLSIRSPVRIPAAWQRHHRADMYVRHAAARLAGPAASGAPQAAPCATLQAQLSHSHVSNAALHAIATHAPKLKRLVLANITSVTDLRPLASMQHLEKVQVHDCPIVHGEAIFATAEGAAGQQSAAE